MPNTIAIDLPEGRVLIHDLCCPKLIRDALARGLGCRCGNCTTISHWLRQAAMASGKCGFCGAAVMHHPACPLFIAGVGKPGVQIQPSPATSTSDKDGSTLTPEQRRMGMTGVGLRHLQADPWNSDFD